MRIMIVTDQFPPVHFGGMAQHAFHIARYLSRKHDVIVATLREHASAAHTSEKFAVNPLLTKRFPKLDFWCLRRLARSFGADVIHSCTAGLADERISKEFPVVTRVVGNDFLRPWCGYNLPLRSLLYRLPGSAAKASVQSIEIRRRQGRVLQQLGANALVVANSNWTRGQLIERGINPEKVRLVVGGLDTDIFQPTRDKAFVRKQLGLPLESPLIMTAGNLIGKKGFNTILRVLSEMEGKDRPYYIILGDGPEEGQLRQLAGQLGVEKQVLFAGRKNQAVLAQYYQAMDVYVQTSRNHKLFHGCEDIETMGRTYFEAGACGIPVVGARVGGVPDVVQHGENGLLVDDPENLDAIADCIRRLLGDPDLRKRMGAAGLKRAREEFSWEAVGRTFEMLLVGSAEVLSTSKER